MTKTDNTQQKVAKSSTQANSATVADVLCKYAMDNPALPKGTQQRIAKQAADLLNKTNIQASCN